MNVNVSVNVNMDVDAVMCGVLITIIFLSVLF